MSVDYTIMAIGKKVMEGIPDIDPETGEDVGEVIGEIEVCPHCGRNGLAQLKPHGWEYTHTQTIGQAPGGTYILGWDVCPKPSSPEDHP